jgi:hypothetical protein
MSTKTTFKRIALVAVAALGFGMLSVVPSSAATVFAADNVTVVTPSSSTTVGTAATTVVKLEGICLGAYTHYDNANTPNDGGYGIQNNIGAWGLVLQSVPSGLTSYTAGTLTVRATDTTYPYVGVPTMIQAGGSDPAAVALQCSASGGQTGYATASFTPSKEGTYTFKIKGVFQAYAEASWTVVATAIDNVANAGKTTSFLNAGETTTVTSSADTVVSASMATSTTAAATIVVTPKNAADVALSALTTAATVPLTVTVSGPGTVAVATNLAGITSLDSGTGRAVTGTTGHYVIGVFADGTAGVSTITISTGTTVLATETVTFYGAVASYSATVAKSVIPMGATTTGVVAVVAKDKDGNVVPSQTVHVKASDATVVANYTGTSASAAEAAAGTATIQVIGIASKFGQLTLTIGNADVATITTTAVVTLSSTTAKTVTLAFDKAEYSAGEKMTLKATAVDANGLPVAPMDPISGTPTANTSLFGFPTTWDTTTTGGSVSYTMYAPLVPGPITVTGTDSNEAAITASATVISDGVAQAAADAATDAYDAALAATDAANDATAAAEAATAAAEDAADAVAALATQVTEMVNALKKQITALTNLVIKIQKKVKA